MNMTPTSGIDLHPSGMFTIGVEAFFNTPTPPSGPHIATLESPIPSGSVGMKIIGGSVKLKPPFPRFSYFGQPRYENTDGLFRIFLLNDDHREFLALSMILSAWSHPESLSIGAATVPLSVANSEIIGANRIEVEFQQAGSGQGSNMELQLVGQFEK